MFIYTLRGAGLEKVEKCITASREFLQPLPLNGKTRRTGGIPSTLSAPRIHLPDLLLSGAGRQEPQTASNFTARLIFERSENNLHFLVTRNTEEKRIKHSDIRGLSFVKVNTQSLRGEALTSNGSPQKSSAHPRLPSLPRMTAQPWSWRMRVLHNALREDAAESGRQQSGIQSEKFSPILLPAMM